MDLLRRLTKYALIALPLMVGGCLVAEQFGAAELGPAFPHSKHGEEAGLECASCHRKAESDEQAGMPTLSQCKLCHKELDEGKPAERTAAAFFPDGKAKTELVTGIGDEVMFSHQLHVVDHGLACADCHGDVAASERVTADVRVTMPKCVACHEKTGKQTTCEECHTEIRAERAPANHAFDWKRSHGHAASRQGGDALQGCMLCHAPRDCQTCHQTEAPADHSNYWRRRGHGVAAAIDRERCTTCHQADGCERCHRESAPLSHTAGWGSPRDRHCVTCHFPLGTGDGCATCHRSATSHLLAAPMPPGHSPGMNCRQCHGLTAPLPHPDKGDNCVGCHK